MIERDFQSRSSNGGSWIGDPGQVAFTMRGNQSSITIAERSQVGEARREAQRLVELAGFPEADAGRAAIVVAELTTNLARYAEGGRILLSTETIGGRVSLDVLTIDSGPGMADVARCLVDGYSTGGTPGNGLGAVQRLSNLFDLYSSVPGGTVIYSRIDVATAPGGFAAQRAAETTSFSWGILCQPMPRETVCGDTWRLAIEEDRLAILMADGLGHGPEANAAAELAGEAFDNRPFDPPGQILETAHALMRGSRGGAVSTARIDARTGGMVYAGVGNISGSLAVGGEGPNRGLMSHNGIVGVQIRKIQEFSYECPPQSLLILHSDGLQSRWSLGNFPGLSQRHPAVIAGVLYRDFNRGRDDVTVAVVRRNAPANSIQSREHVGG